MSAEKSSRTPRITCSRLIAVSAVVGVVLLAFSTRLGPGVGGDATIYLTAARNLLSGVGLGLVGPEGEFRLLPYFAPFYSLVLSFIGLFSADLLKAAQQLNLFLFGAMILIAGRVTAILSRSPRMGLLAALLVMLSPILMPVYSWAMSEPLALLLGFVGLILLLIWLREGAPRGYFYGSALLVGLSFLTRYSSAAFVGAGMLGLLTLQPGSWGRRIRQAVLYGGAASLPMIPWVIVNLTQTDTLSSRSLETAGGMAQRFVAFWPQLSEVVLAWLVPFSWIEQPPYPALINRLLPLALLAAVTGAIVWVGVQARRSGWKLAQDQRLRWVALLVFLLGLYLVVILFVYVTTYPPITIENRMFSPAHLGLLLLIPMLAALAPEFAPQRWLRLALPLALLVLAGWYGWRTVRIVQQNFETGLGYNSLAWQQSETVQALRELPADQPVVTNETMAVLYLTGRRAYTFQEIYLNQPLDDFSRYGEGGDDAGQRAFAEGRAVLVLFDSLPAQLESLYAGRTPQRMEALTAGLPVLFRGRDGVIYGRAAGQP